MTDPLPIAPRRMTCLVCMRAIEKDTQFMYVPFGKHGAVQAVHISCAKEAEKR